MVFDMLQQLIYTETCIVDIKMVRNTQQQLANHAL